MMYIDFVAGGKSYKLRLNTRTIVLLERKLGCNPITVFIDEHGKEKALTVETMVTILHHALMAYHPNITLDDTYTIFDEWLEDGHITSEFVAIVVEIYRESGLFRKEKDEKN